MWKKCAPLWREAHSQVKSVKAHHARTTFGSWDVEKVHAVLVRSTFGSKNVQNTSALGRLLEVEMWKKCTPFWREAHLEVKMLKLPQVRATFGSWDVEKVHAVVAREAHFEVKTVKIYRVRTIFGSWKLKKYTPLWREAHLEVKMRKLSHVRGHFWKWRYRKSARRCGAKHISKWKSTKHLGFGPLFDDSMAIRCRKVAGRQICQKVRVKTHFWCVRCHFCLVN